MEFNFFTGIRQYLRLPWLEEAKYGDVVIWGLSLNVECGSSGRLIRKTNLKVSALILWSLSFYNFVTSSCGGGYKMYMDLVKYK